MLSLTWTFAVFSNFNYVVTVSNLFRKLKSKPSGVLETSNVAISLKRVFLSLLFAARTPNSFNLTPPDQFVYHSTEILRFSSNPVETSLMNLSEKPA